MSYKGRPLDRGNYLKLDDISSSFNSSTKTFNLTVGSQAFYPGSAFSIMVSLGGVLQEPESAYTIDQSQITFAVAPSSGSTFFCIALSQALSIGVPGNGTVDGTKLAGTVNHTGTFNATNLTSGITSITQLSVSGVSTLGTVKISSGIITSSSGVVTYYGDGRNLSGIITSKNLTIGTRTTAATISVVGTGMTISRRSGIGTVNF